MIQIVDSKRGHMNFRLFAQVRGLLATIIVLVFTALFCWGLWQMTAPLSSREYAVVNLEARRLPAYALHTTLRMLLALVASFLFTFVYSTIAAKNRKAEQLLIPLLDILQSVPVLGYLSFTVTAFLALFPNRALGAEMASIFAIFTAQAWNMAFSFYQSLRTLPHDLEEVSRVFQFGAWQKFWRLEVPFAMPGLIWNTMMSMSGAWFFVVASEAITVGEANVMLPGVGSYVALAIIQKNTLAILYAMATMLIVIIVYDQLLFRPLVVWSQKFSFEEEARVVVGRSWFLGAIRTAPVFQFITFTLMRMLRASMRWHCHLSIRPFFYSLLQLKHLTQWANIAWYGILLISGIFAAARGFEFISKTVGWAAVAHVAFLGLLTLLRVFVLLMLATAIWLPLGILIGLNPRLSGRVQALAQFLAAFPTNLLFPWVTLFILYYNLNPDIWLSTLMILGTQWYILFNVIAGASVFPTDLKDAAAGFGLRGWIWWKKVMLPGVFPYYVTGAITAAGGSWNASIVAETVSWGNTTLTAQGLGSYIAEWTTKGDLTRITVGVAVMSVYIVLINRLLWRPLYELASRRLRLD